MKLMTLNLNVYEPKHGPWAVRKELIVQAVRQQAPDVLALQAVGKHPAKEGGTDQATQLAERLPGYRHATYVAATRRADGSEEGSAFLAKLPLAKVDHCLLSMGINPEEKAQDRARRVIVHARIAVPALSIFNSHYSWVYSQAVSNVNEALTYMADTSGPALLVGDLNTVPESDLMGRLAAQGWTDVWAWLRPHDPGYTFESNRPDKRIDYVWARPEALRWITAIDLVKEQPNPAGARLSDHLGLVVSLDEKQ
ncbi:endonuclease/exonuclease/phosphatase family protein [Nitrospira sp. Nam74]